MKYVFFPLLLILFFISVGDFFHFGLPITHDGQDHATRIANFFLNLRYGVIIPRWAPNLNWGYGHPILEFLYPLPSYISSFFHFLGFSFIDSVKIVYVLGMIGSGISMYFWLSSFLKKPASALGSVIYVFTAYRFVEIYVRGDIGENLGFIFIPLVLLFIFKLSSKFKNINIVLGSICLAFFILSHNAMSLMFLPLIILYSGYLFLFASDKKSFFYSVVLIFIFGFGISSFFWIPALLEGKFTLRNIVTAGVYKSRFVNFSQLIYGVWSYGGTGLFTVQLGIINWLALILSFVSIPILMVRKDKRLLLIAIFSFYSLVAIFLMLNASNFIWSHVILLQNFQFPWRMLAITVFTTSVLGAVIIEYIPKKISTFVIGLVIIILLTLNSQYWHANGYLYKNDSFFSSVYNGTTDTGESSPVWSVRFMEKRPVSHMQIILGKGTIAEKSRMPLKHNYQIISTTNVRILENTLYFPGWSITVDDKKVPIQFQDPSYRGLMTFFVPKGEHLISVAFAETKVRLFSDIISLGSIIGICSLLLWRRKV